MADISAQFTLATGVGSIVFNDDSADQFYLTETTGLEGAPIRSPVDPVPFGDGGLIHDFWLGPREMTFEGVFLITSTRVQNSILTIRNTMEEDLRIALDSLLRANGTLTWTPLGEAQRAIVVRHNMRLECRHLDNYLLRGFTFGLIAADPDLVEST